MGAAFFGDSGLHIATFQCDPELDNAEVPSEQRRPLEQMLTL